MTEFELQKHVGQSTGMSGSERTMYQHVSRPDLLVGIEHRMRNPDEMHHYKITNNIFKTLFPDNFPRVVRAGTHEGKSYALVTRANASPLGYGQGYTAARARFEETIGAIFAPDERPAIRQAFDFKGTNPNLLVDPQGNPVYVDKIDPHILFAIDLDRIDSVVPDPRKAELLRRVIIRTRGQIERYDKRRAELEKILGEW